MSGLDTFLEIRYFQPTPLVVLISERKNIVMAVHSLRHSAFRYLTSNPPVKIKIKTLMEKMMYTKEMIRRKYYEIVFYRALISIGIPVFVYLFLETFCK